MLFFGRATFRPTVMISGCICSQKNKRVALSYSPSWVKILTPNQPLKNIFFGEISKPCNCNLCHQCWYLSLFFWFCGALISSYCETNCVRLWSSCYIAWVSRRTYQANTFQSHSGFGNEVFFFFFFKSAYPLVSISPPPSSSYVTSCSWISPLFFMFARESFL